MGTQVHENEVLDARVRWNRGTPTQFRSLCGDLGGTQVTVVVCVGVAIGNRGGFRAHRHNEHHDCKEPACVVSQWQAVMTCVSRNVQVCTRVHVRWGEAWWWSGEVKNGARQGACIAMPSSESEQPRESLSRLAKFKQHRKRGCVNRDAHGVVERLLQVRVRAGDRGDTA